MVADGGGLGQTRQHRAVQIGLVLLLAGGSVHLIPGGEEECGVGEHLHRFRQRGIPAAGVGGQIAGAAQLGITHKQESGGFPVTGGEGADGRGHRLPVSCVGQLIGIGRTPLQTGEGQLVAVPAAPVGGGGHGGGGGCVLRHPAIRQVGCGRIGDGAGFCGGGVPGEVHFRLICAYRQGNRVLHQSQIAVIRLLRGQRQGLEVKVDIGAACSALMDFHGQDIGALLQCGGIGQCKLAQLGGRGIGAAVFHVLTEAALRLVESGHLAAVQVNDCAVIVIKGAQNLPGLGQLPGSHAESGDKEAGFDIIAVFFVLVQQGLGGAAAAQIGDRAVFGAEGAGVPLPVGILQEQSIGPEDPHRILLV